MNGRTNGMERGVNEREGKKEGIQFSLLRVQIKGLHKEKNMGPFRIFTVFLM